jgi:hypothetical protein
VPVRAITRAVALATVAAALGAVPVAAAAPPPPPRAVQEFMTEPRFVLSLPADGGAWTVWSGLVGPDRWYALSSPRAGRVTGAACADPSRLLTVCFHGSVVAGRRVVVGRVRATTVAAFDDGGRRLRSIRRGDSYLVVSGEAPTRVTVVGRDARKRVVARRTLVYGPR